MDQSEKDAALFFSLVMMFQTAAMQHLGKIKNPATDTIERNLEQAQVMIDMLDMISAKTKGNLTPDESRYLQNVIQELKLNYVDEESKEPSQQTEKKETA